MDTPIVYGLWGYSQSRSILSRIWVIGEDDLTALADIESKIDGFLDGADKRNECYGFITWEYINGVPSDVADKIFQFYQLRDEYDFIHTFVLEPIAQDYAITGFMS